MGSAPDYTESVFTGSNLASVTQRKNSEGRQGHCAVQCAYCTVKSQGRERNLRQTDKAINK